MEKQTVAGRYQIVREIARGGMGSVHEAFHVVSKKRVALKLLFPQAVKDESSRQRFLREASAPAQIGHEGIVEVYDAGVDDDGSLFVAMEFLEGGTLRDRIDRGPLSLPEIFSIFVRMLEPLAAAHARGIIHRDLKPENVFLQQKANGTEVVKIVDFGIARDLEAAQQSMTQTGIAMGTPHYMAPEQAMSARGVVATADVWAIGAMLYEVLTGHVPFEGETSSAVIVHVCTQPHRPLAQVAPGVPPQLAALVDRCLAKHADQRPHDASVVLAELRGIAAALGIAVPPPGVLAVPSGGAAVAGSAPGYATGQPAAAYPTPAPYGQTPPPGMAYPTPAPAYGAPMPGHVTGQPMQGYPTPQPTGQGPAYGPPGGQTSPAFGAALPAPARSKKLMFGAAFGLLSVCVVCGVGLYFVGEQAQTSATATAPTLGAQPGPAVVAPSQPQPAVPAPTTGIQHFTGSLAAGDRTLQSGEFMDVYKVAFTAGQRFRARLHSEKLDTYLIVRSPSGQSHDNDDADANTRDAQLELTADEAGEWTLVATTFAAGQTGDYELTIEPLP